MLVTTPDAAHGIDSAVHFFADREDLACDLFRGLGCLGCESLYFGGDDREAPACFAGACRFDGGIQGQQVRLLGNRLDHVDHTLDVIGLGRERLDDAMGIAGVGVGVGRNSTRTVGEVGHVADRGAELLGCGGNGLDFAVGRISRGRDLARVGIGAGRGCCHLLCRALEFACSRGHGADDGADMVLELAGRSAVKRRRSSSWARRASS